VLVKRGFGGFKKFFAQPSASQLYVLLLNSASSWFGFGRASVGFGRSCHLEKKPTKENHLQQVYSPKTATRYKELKDNTLFKAFCRSGISASHDLFEPLLEF
jgi:hypothetical protein